MLRIPAVAYALSTDYRIQNEWQGDPKHATKISFLPFWDITSDNNNNNNNNHDNVYGAVIMT